MGGHNLPALRRRTGSTLPAREPSRVAPQPPVQTVEDAAGSPPGPAADLQTSGRSGVTASRQSYRRWLAVVGLVYVLVFGGILVWSGGLPFITDSNESFSTLWHARHIATYGASGSYLLADEVFSPHPEAHPFVHTHQGNFPRLYALVLYVLGARSVESQVIVTTFTVGVLTIWLCYHLFTKMAGPRAACLVTLVLMTDYLFFAQWQVVTYRVWHACFVFAGLVCVHGLAESARPRRWLALLAVCSACLFYYELVFAAFVSIFWGLYAAWVMRRSFGRVVAFGTMQVAGGAAALAILLVQLVGYLGWDGVREDLAITYVARNLANDASADSFSPSSMHAYFAFIGRLTATDPALQARLERFFSTHDVIFWWNLVDSRPLRTMSFFVGTIFVWVFQIYTPLLVLLVGTVLAGWLLGIVVGALPAPNRLFSRWQRDRRAGVALGVRLPLVRGRFLFDVKLNRVVLPISLGRVLAVARVAVTVGPFALALLYLLISLFRDQAFLGLPASSASFIQSTGGRALVGVLLGTALGCLLLVWFWTGRVRSHALLCLPVMRCWAAAVLLFGLTRAIRTQDKFYDQQYAPIWFGQIGDQLPATLLRLAVLLAAGLAVSLIFTGDRRLLGAPGALVLRRMSAFVAIGAVAYATVYYLAAGYVLTGYLVRYGPLLVFVTDALIAMALLIVILAAGQRLHRLRAAAAECAAWLDSARVRAPRWRDRPEQTAFLARGAHALAGVVACGALVLLLTGYWLHVQAYYVRQFPPTHFSFLRMLDEPPYAGATFVASSYSAPVAWQVQNWAYFDPMFGQDQVTVQGDEVRMQRDLVRYVWLADREENPAYLRPDYFVCMTPRHLRGVLEQLTRPTDRVGLCSEMPIVKRALAGPRPYLNHQVVARDLTDVDSWAILRLDWSVPPGLRLVDPEVALPAVIDPAPSAAR